MAIESVVRRGVIAGLLCCAIPGHAQTVDRTRVDQLARDIERVESVRAIKNLQIALAQDIEAGRWTDAAGRFSATADAVWGERRLTGRSRIAQDLPTRFGTTPGGSLRTIHAQILLSPVITLSPDGRSARGRWHDVSMLGRVGEEASWAGGIFENAYARSPDGRWRITRLAYHPVFRGPYDKGWHNVDDDQAPVPFHYDAASVGLPATLGERVPAAAAPARGALPGSRIGRLLDTDAVANLQNAFGYYVDRKMWDEVADLFDAGGTYTEGRGPTLRGSAAIRAELTKAGTLDDGELNDHVQANLLVCVSPDGATARVRGLELGMTGRNEGKGYWSLTLFENSFVKRDGRWRIATMRLLPRMKTDYALGWALSALAEPLHTPETDRAFDCPPGPDSKAGAAPIDVQALALERERLSQAAGRDTIEHLMSAFGNYIDDYRWDDLGSLFAADGRREAPGVGFYVGPERITHMQRMRYGDYQPPRSFIPIHTLGQPVTSMAPDGASAKIRTRLLQYNTGRIRDGSMMAGIYENEAVLVDGVWKLKSVEIDHTLQTANYKDGWTRIAQGTGMRMIPPATKLLEGFPPDSPNEGEIYAPYPARGLMWFHYDNPVSGRAPPLKTPKTAAVVSQERSKNGK